MKFSESFERQLVKIAGAGIDPTSGGMGMPAVAPPALSVPASTSKTLYQQPEEPASQPSQPKKINLTAEKYLERGNFSGKFNPGTFESGVSNVESGGGKNMINPNTSAAGTYQFIKPTALGLGAQDPTGFRQAFGADPSAVKTWSRDQYQQYMASHNNASDFLMKLEEGGIGEFLKAHNVPEDQQQRIAALYHFGGPARALEYLKSGRTKIPGS